MIQSWPTPEKCYLVPEAAAAQRTSLSATAAGNPRGAAVGGLRYVRQMLRRANG